MEECRIQVLFYDNEARDIFRADTVLERLADGFGFSEGPVWMDGEDCLYFTDFPNESIYRWTRETGAVLHTAVANRAIGLTVDGEGRLISCESRLRRVARIPSAEHKGADGAKETGPEADSCVVADRYQGKFLNSPNDVIVSAGGEIFFTDPLSGALGMPGEQGFNGVYQVLRTGEVRLVSGEIGRPNGLALSRDESVLYVNDTDENVIYAFAKQEAGEDQAERKALSTVEKADGGDKNESQTVYGQKKEFARLDASFGEGACDGMKVDRFGHIWVTGPGGIWMLNRFGKRMAIIGCPEFAGNFCFGGRNGNELFITASTSLYRMQLAKPMT